MSEEGKQAFIEVSLICIAGIIIIIILDIIGVM